MRAHLHRFSQLGGRLTVKVTFYVALMLVVFAALTVGSTIREGDAMLREHLLARTDDLGAVVADLVASHLDELNEFELDELVRDAALRHNVTHVAVVDARGSIIAEGNRDSDRFLRRSESPIVARALAEGHKVVEMGEGAVDGAYPVRLGSKLVGAVHLRLNLDAVHAAMERVRQRQVLLGIMLVGLSMPVAVWAASSATRGIRRMTAAVRGVAAGSLDIQLGPPAHGEVGELQQAFGHMLTDLKSNLAEIERLAFSDIVTGLPNRQAFSRAVRDRLAAAAPIVPGAILFIDLDRFKQVNDTLGHNAGDDLLRLVSSRFRATLGLEGDDPSLCSPQDRTEPVLARLGGDEFTVLLPKVAAEEHAAEVATRLMQVLDAPFPMQGQEIRIGASIGVTLYPRDGSDNETLLRNADLAMYAAKDAGRHTLRFYSAELERQAMERLTLERELRAALANEELVVYYQPQVSCASGRINSAEALVRWAHPWRGLLPPAAFLPIAEETGLIDQLGWYVMERAARDAAALARAGRPTSIAVNVSALQFERADFVERVEQILKSSGLPAHLLELELTESIAMRDPDRVIARVTPLRDRGVRFAIDDFGTGYSSLSYLTRLPIDTIKIDRSFIQAAGRNATDKALVNMILQMADSLKLATVAEGIENEDDFAFVRNNGATTAQGFLFSPALPYREFSALAGLFQPWGGLASDEAPEEQNARSA